MNPTISTLELPQLASGDRPSIQVYKFSGAQPGKKAYLQANLHGAEIVGNAVIYQLIEILHSLDPEQLVGEIVLVPVCNPFGTNQRSHFYSTGRFNSYNGTDWNRIFWDYEKECDNLEEFARSQSNHKPETIRKNYLQKIQSAFEKQLENFQTPSSATYNEQYRYQLQSLCLDANYVIDLHSSSNQAIEYLYCFHDREESAKSFLVDAGVVMKEQEYDGNAFDEAFIKPWLALERTLAQLGNKVIFDIESWTLELGSGMKMNPDSVETGVRGVQNYLAQKGMLKLNKFPLSETDSHQVNLVGRSQVKKYYAPAGGMVQNRVELKSKVEKGEKVYQLLTFNKKGELPTVIEVRAEKAGLVFDVSTNQAANQGEYVLSIMQL